MRRRLSVSAAWPLSSLRSKVGQIPAEDTLREAETRGIGVRVLTAHRPKVWNGIS